mmetsp:Transcript_21373/g.54394  ORF Transcript_21373/g.54394 Transcript_21373/m.54394 type:complete len:224 (+) Transcript_21373:561-1232(+)
MGVLRVLRVLLLLLDQVHEALHGGRAGGGVPLQQLRGASRVAAPAGPRLLLVQLRQLHEVGARRVRLQRGHLLRGEVRGQLVQLLRAVHRLERGRGVADVVERDELLVGARRRLVDVLDLAKLGEQPHQVVVCGVRVQVEHHHHALLHVAVVPAGGLGGRIAQADGLVADERALQRVERGHRRAQVVVRHAQQAAVLGARVDGTQVAKRLEDVAQLLIRCIAG